MNHWLFLIWSIACLSVCQNALFGAIRCGGVGDLFVSQNLDNRGMDSVRRDDLQKVAIKLPTEGRWSIATGWEDGWPTDWQHTQPSRTETVGKWTLHHGRLALREGDWLLRDAVRELDDGLVEYRRRWEWTGKVPLENVTLSVRWQVEGTGARPFLPAISYYDNPAGQSVDGSRIPVIGNQPSCRGFYEEHRY
ncbi:MAG: hypothetical protein GY904_14245 [Planctomycetaceae bacterium]|nr:hypothetical protein [Planctomycetaceae bacterium]